MRRALLAAVLLLLLSPPGVEAQPLAAYLLETTPTTEVIRGLGGNQTTTYAVGDNGLVMQRTPFGVWNLEDSNVDDRLRSITHSSLVTAASGDNGTIIEDGLLGWFTASTGTTVRFDRVRASSTEAYAFGEGGLILERTAPGIWSDITSPTTRTISDAEIAPNGTWYAVTRGAGGCDVLTHQTGGAWNIHSTFPDGCGLFTIAADGTNLYIAGSNGRFSRYDEGTDSWINETTGASGTIRAIEILGDGTVIAAGGSGQPEVYERSPLGVWGQRTTPPDMAAISDAFSNTHGAFIGSLEGIVARRDPAASLGGDNCAGITFCDVRRYELASHAETSINPSTGTVFSFDYDGDAWHDFVVGNTTINYAIQYTATVTQDTTGIYRLQAFRDGGLIPGCEWFLYTLNPGGFLSGDLLTHQTVISDCDFPIGSAGPGGIHTFSLVLDVVSGNPSDINTHAISVQVLRQDTIDLESYQYRADVDADITDLETFAEEIDMGLTEIAAFYEFAFWMLVFIAALVWGGYTKQYWVLTGGFVGIISIFTPLGDWDTESVFILTLIGAVIGAFMRFFQRKREPATTEENMTRFT